METVGYATLQIIPSAKGFQSALEKETGPSLGRVGDKAGKDVGGKFKSGFSSAIRGLAAPLAATLGTVAVVDFFKSAIGGASDLAESANKLQQVFGPATASVTKFAKGADAALGQSQQQARDAAATFGIFGKSAGLQGQKLAGFSTKLTTLAGDMASFSNTTPQQAIEALGAALRGEAEPIRAYGVLLDDATLKAEAMSLGILKPVKDASKIQAAQARVTIAQAAYNKTLKDGGKGNLDRLKAQAALGSAQSTLQKATEGTIPALTQQQKILAAQSAIFKQTKDQQGDFSRTSSGLANQQRILSAEFENAKAKIGEGLLPIAQKLIHFLVQEGIPAFQTAGDWFTNKGVPALKELGDKAGELADHLVPIAKDLFPQLKELGGNVADALGGIAKVMGGLVDGFSNLPGPVKQFATEAGAAVIVMAKLKTAMAGSAFIASISTFSTNMKTAETRMAALKSTSKTLAGAGGMLALYDSTKRTSGVMGDLEATAGGAATGFAIAGPWGAVAGGAIAGGLKLLGNNAQAAALQMKNGTPKAQNFVDTLNKITGAATKGTRALIGLDLQKAGIPRAAVDIGVNENDLVGYIAGNKAAQRRVQKNLDDFLKLAKIGPDGIAKGLKTGAVTEGQLLDLKKVSDFLKINADARAKQGAKLAADTREQRKLLGGYARALKDLPKAAFIKLKQEGFTPTIKQLSEIRRTTDGLTKKDLRLIIKETGADVVLTKTGQLITKAELLRRRDVNLKIKALGLDDVKKHVDDVDKSLSGLLKKNGKSVKIKVEIAGIGSGRHQGIALPGFASGGKVGGFGNGDKQLLLADRREWIINPKASEFYGDTFLNALNKMQVPRFAQGGPVSAASTEATRGGVHITVGEVRAHSYRDFVQQMHRRVRASSASEMPIAGM